jgi:hypothetical protein
MQRKFGEGVELNRPSALPQTITRGVKADYNTKTDRRPRQYGHGQHDGTAAQGTPTSLRTRLLAAPSPKIHPAVKRASLRATKRACWRAIP